jgi:S1-C subfamily serine protease
MTQSARKASYLACLFVALATNSALLPAQESYLDSSAARSNLGSPVDSTSFRSTLSPGTGMWAVSAIRNDDFPLPATSSALGNLRVDRGPSTRNIRDAALFNKVAPSVVLIVTKDGLGSGSLISRDGQIITNWHVVSGAKDVGVIFKPAREGAKPTKGDVRRARLLKFDQISDLALIKVDDLPGNVVPMVLGTQSDIAVGIDVHAIGHPTGEAWTYTKGVISQYRMQYGWTSSDPSMEHFADVIQTQTPINPGNSGGPLLVDSGAMIGINSFQVRETQGLNFAVAIEDIRNFLSRPGDRYAKSASSPSKKVEASKCEEKELYRGQNAERDGDVVQIDFDCSGQVDAEVRIPYDASKPIVLVIDRNHDTLPDVMIFDTDRDGKWDFSVWDNDFDGNWDLIGIHTDGSLKPTRFVTFDPTSPILAGVK